MKRTLQIVLFMLALGVLLSSCSMQKRIYMPGYSVMWKSSNVAKDKSPVTARPAAPDQNLYASTDKEPLITGDLSNFPELNVISSASDTCDTIVLKNGNLMFVAVMDVTEGYIEYKKCDDKEGTSRFISRPKVTMIKYTNGTREVIEEKQKPPVTADNKDNKGNKTESEGPRIQPINLGGIISSGIGFILACVFGPPLTALPLLIGVLLSIAGIAFSGTSIAKIDKYPELWKGLNLAKVGVGIGILTIVLTFIFMIAKMTF